MTEVVIIAAVAKNRVIGRDGKIPWHISEDLKRFKALTLGYPIVMGRKTFESLPVKPLKGRTNIVITSQKGYKSSGIVVRESVRSALDYCKDSDKVFLIGGQRIFEEGLKFADRLELTNVKQEYDGDAFFPEIDFSEWRLEKSDDHGDYSFDTYVRRQSL